MVFLTLHYMHIIGRKRRRVSTKSGSYIHHHRHTYGTVFWGKAVDSNFRQQLCIAARPQARNQHFFLPFSMFNNIPSCFGPARMRHCEPYFFFFFFL